MINTYYNYSETLVNETIKIDPHLQSDLPLLSDCGLMWRCKIRHGTSSNSKKKVKKIMKILTIWGKKIGNRIFWQPRKSSMQQRKIKLFRKHFYRWISMKAGCSLHHRQIAKTGRNFTFPYNQADTIHCHTCSKINCNLSFCKSASSTAPFALHSSF